MESFADDLRRMQRTPLSEAHVAVLQTVSREQDFAAGEVVMQPGEPLDTFLYILEGALEVFDPLTGEAYLPTFLGPGQFAGEIGFLNGMAATLALRARDRSRVLVASRDDVLLLMSKIPEMSDIIVSVYAARRRRQIEAGDGNLSLIGADESRDVRRVESFLSRNKIPFRSLTIGDPLANTLCDGRARPGVVFNPGEVIEEPKPRQVAALLGLDQPIGEGSKFDVLIVGGGPGGVAAAVYAGAEGLGAVVVEEIAVGGQAGASSRVENFMGFPTGISGSDLVWRGEIQAMKFGTCFVLPRRVTELSRTAEGRFHVDLSDGSQMNVGAVVIATGVQYRRLSWKRLDDFEGAGIYYAATQTEARYTRGEPVVIVGGGNSAGQAAMYLSRTASHVHLMVRGQSLATSMSDYLTNRLEADPRITIHFGAEIIGLDGSEQLSKVSFRRDGETHEMAAKGVFVMVGAVPNTGWLPNEVALDAKGFVETGTAVGGGSQYETSVPGIFAVGDVRSGSVKRVASAVGEGSVVISDVWSYVRDAEP